MGDFRKVRRVCTGVVLALLFVFSADVFSQSNSLYVFKPGKKTRYEYHIGSSIALRPKQNFPIQRGIIYQISDSCIYFSAVDSINISSIQAVVINEDPRFFGKGFWWKNMLATAGGIGIWQIMYLVNQGELSPDVKSAPYIIAFSGFVPLTVNGIVKLFARERVLIGPGEWQIGTIVLK